MKPITAALLAGGMSALVGLLRDGPTNRILLVATITGCLVFALYSYLYDNKGGPRE